MSGPIVSSMLVLALFASAASAQYDPFAYDPWLDPQMEAPDPYAPDLSPSPWAAPSADYWAERQQRLQDQLSRDPLGQPRYNDPLVDYYQRRDEERSHSLNACLGIHSNPAAQQACLERLQ